MPLMIRTIFTIHLLCILAIFDVKSQDNAYQSIDAIIDALYDVISGPAGERDWDRFHGLFYRGASMGAVQKSSGGDLTFAMFSPEAYVAKNGPFFEQRGFWEEEIGRTTSRFGELAHVFSAYQFRLDSEDAPVSVRGVNSIQLIYESDRWWVVSVYWNAERDDLPLPADLTSK